MATIALAIALAGACESKSKSKSSAGSAGALVHEGGASDPAAGTEVDLPNDSAQDSDVDADVDPERAHTVVFADRTSQGYLLLLTPGALPSAPTRAQLDAWIVAQYPGRADEGEVSLMRSFVATEPHDTALAAQDVAELQNGQVVLRDGLENRNDLLGLHIELLPRSPNLLDPGALADPIATRELSASERESIASRTQVLLLRGDYRNLHDVRGLRLLQSVVAIVAERSDALIFDPDTLETVGAPAFARKQLTANASNVVDQLAIVPFADPARPSALRLATRGMRRFGAPDIELGGLPRDPVLLQRASDLLAGLARVMVDAAAVDASGLAVSADEMIELRRRDVDRAYADASDRLPPRCSGCTERIVVHLVRRDPLPTDAQDHLTVRVVAPREQSDASDYDQGTWAMQAIANMFGDPAAP